MLDNVGTNIICEIVYQGELVFAQRKMSKKFLQEFIICLENQPAIWHAKCEAYKNKNLRNTAWEVLLEKYKEIDEDATIDTVKKKVNSLRASYRRELLKVRRSAGTDDVYQPNLWYFSELSFLHETESSVDGIPSFDDRQENEIPKAPKRKHDESSEFLQKTVGHLDNINGKQPKCEADIYAEGWAAMFKQLSTEQQLFAKKGIDELLMQGRMNMLTYQGVSSIANIPSKINIKNKGNSSWRACSPTCSPVDGLP